MVGGQATAWTALASARAVSTPARWPRYSAEVPRPGTNSSLGSARNAARTASVVYGPPPRRSSTPRRRSARGVAPVTAIRGPPEVMRTAVAQTG
ncbi:hypothetical protein CG724_20995 [Streptomyces sp. CB02120-2]|nr:hypothetical protein CG724_20995 [Streptomyces sp. CB02120-2]